MELVKDLGFKSDAELVPLGFYRDEIGQVRAKDTNELVCGVSGRRHRQYLLLVPQFVPGGRVLPLYVDKQTAIAAGAGLASLLQTAGTGLVRHGSDLLKRFLEAALLKFLHL